MVHPNEKISAFGMKFKGRAKDAQKAGSCFDG